MEIKTKKLIDFFFLLEKSQSLFLNYYILVILISCLFYIFGSVIGRLCNLAVFKEKIDLLS